MSAAFPSSRLPFSSSSKALFAAQMVMECSASSLLSVGEFRVFEIAYEAWYGEAGKEKMIEKHFTGYIPPYIFVKNRGKNSEADNNIKHSIIIGQLFSVFAF